MTTPDELEVGAYYQWVHQGITVKVLQIIGDAENGGSVLVEMNGEHTPIGLDNFLRRFKRVWVSELKDAE